VDCVGRRRSCGADGSGVAVLKLVAGPFGDDCSFSFWSHRAGAVPLLACHAQKFVRAFALGIDPKAL
jgi:hypothetical protein